MNCGTKLEKRGASLQPSARRSIHNHGNCPFAFGESAMGRYGVSERLCLEKSRSASRLSERGGDEVDNVLSKMIKPGIEITQRNFRKNYDINTLEDFDESDRLSKSLPAYLPSNSFCSDDSDSETNETHTSGATSEQLQHLHSRSQNTTSCSDLSQTYSESFERSQDNVQKSMSSDVQFPVIFVVLAVVVLLISGIFYISFTHSPQTSQTSYTYSKVNFCNDIKKLGEKYKINDDSILQLQSGISSISTKQDTGSFMFVYDSEVKAFDSKAFHHFVNEVASLAARYLRNESSTVHHVVVDTSNLKLIEDSSELIHKYSDDIEKGGVMLMTEIDSLPSSLAMALHYYCDEYNPLVKKSAMFFTLDIANCSDRKSSHAHIEKCLATKWNGVPPDNMRPLLTRVVSVLIDLTKFS